MIRFEFKALMISIFLFLLLAFIAVYVKDQFIRPFVGDTLAVVWLFFSARAFLDIPLFRLSTGVLFVSYGVELAQYFQLAALLGLDDHQVAKIVLGSTFDMMDLVAYTVGWFLILLAGRLNLHFQDLSNKNA